jgi:hypothetical protein
VVRLLSEPRRAARVRVEDVAGAIGRQDRGKIMRRLRNVSPVPRIDAGECEASPAPKSAIPRSRKSGGAWRPKAEPRTVVPFKLRAILIEGKARNQDASFRRPVLPVHLIEFAQVCLTTRIGDGSVSGQSTTD